MKGIAPSEGVFPCQEEQTRKPEEEQGAAPSDSWVWRSEGRPGPNENHRGGQRHHSQASQDRLREAFPPHALAVALRDGERGRQPLAQVPPVLAGGQPTQ